MRVDVVTDTNRFRNLADQWSQLLSSYDPIPLPLTHRWLINWWRVFGGSKKLHIVTVFGEGKLIAIAPFMIEKTYFRGIPVTLQKLMGNGHSPFCNLIFNAEISEQEKWEAVRSIIQESTADLISFFKVPQTSFVALYLSRQPVSDRIMGITPSIVTPVITIYGNWEDFIKSKSRKFRKSLNNKHNRYSKESDFSIALERIRSREDPCLNEIVTISQESWKRKIGADLGSNTLSREFLLALADDFGEIDKIGIWIMRKEGKPVAYEFQVECDGVVYPINADYSEKYRTYSPGSILEYKVLQSLFEGGRIREYYSCANDYWYLNNWSKDLKHHSTINLFANTFKGRLLYCLEYRLISFLRRLRKKKHIQQSQS